MPIPNKLQEGFLDWAQRGSSDGGTEQPLVSPSLGRFSPENQGVTSQLFELGKEPIPQRPRALENGRRALLQAARIARFVDQIPVVGRSVGGLAIQVVYRLHGIRIR